jgi:hypothetical protein
MGLKAYWADFKTSLQMEMLRNYSPGLALKKLHLHLIGHNLIRCIMAQAATPPTVPPDCISYNLGNFLRRAVLPRAVRHWTLTTLREKLIKIGAKVVRHARQIVFQMAQVAVPRELFRAILEGIGRLRLAPATSG